MHKRSQEREELVQGITGITIFHKFFENEMGVELEGGRTGYQARCPK